MKTKSRGKVESISSKPSFFFSHSTGEQSNALLSTLLWLVFQKQYEFRLTPLVLASGASQLAQIEAEISQSKFGVVCVDGLRPNVMHEWGFMRGKNLPVILLRKDGATIDVRHIVRESAPQLQNPALDINLHLSNLKDLNFATWHPEDPPKSAKSIWEQYKKVRLQRADADLLEIEEPRLW